MELDERKKLILQAVVEGYINTAEPVGSRSIAKLSPLGLSAATIRNEMGDLEEMGLLEQPHTSAGRVPSQLGYRYYVDSLMQKYRMTAQEINQFRATLEMKLQEQDGLIRHISKMFSQLTSMPIIASLESDENRKYLEGRANILGFPEYNDIEKAKNILHVFDDEQNFDEALKVIPQSDNVSIIIGNENNIPELRDCSLVVARYNAGKNIAGTIGIIGPTRMDYSKIVSKLEYLTNELSRRLADDFEEGGEIDDG
ncbi:MAG: heat-inducible transcriptional repressor HrcA [Oscillospiraceae bacterium]|nr:heat-inducible transcriptional repressor HrcA [Oscillospiraceae bacterium]